MNWGEISRCAAVLCRIRIRRELGPVKPECEALDGRVMWLSPLWRIEREDSSLYHGEVALQMPVERDMPIGWIASGDVQPLLTGYET